MPSSPYYKQEGRRIHGGASRTELFPGVAGPPLADGEEEDDDNEVEGSVCSGGSQVARPATRSGVDLYVCASDKGVGGWAALGWAVVPG